MSPAITPAPRSERDIQAAREAFPRGLVQAPGRARFAMDALLLAAFAARHTARRPEERLLELGAGCGAAGLGLLLLRENEHPRPRLLGLDIDEDQIQAARLNAEALGLDARCAFRTCDLRQSPGYDPPKEERLRRPEGAPPSGLSIGDACSWAGRSHQAHEQSPPTEGAGEDHSPQPPEALLQTDNDQPRSLPQAQADLVLANPPYYRLGRGRPANGRRLLARADESAGLNDFLDAAAWLLRNRGRLCLVFTAERVAELLAACRERGLEPKRLLPVASRTGRDARLVLLEARRLGGEGLRLAPPLVLYQGSGKATRLTPQALEFCPFLACNPGATAAADGGRINEIRLDANPRDNETADGDANPRGDEAANRDANPRSNEAANRGAIWTDHSGEGLFTSDASMGQDESETGGRAFDEGPWEEGA